MAVILGAWLSVTLTLKVVWAVVPKLLEAVTEPVKVAPPKNEAETLLARDICPLLLILNNAGATLKVTDCPLVTLKAARVPAIPEVAVVKKLPVKADSII